jgi:hypothetical protein
MVLEIVPSMGFSWGGLYWYEAVMAVGFESSVGAGAVAQSW